MQILRVALGYERRSRAAAIAAMAVMGWLALVPCASGARAEDEPMNRTGKAALEHPAGRAVVAAAGLLHAGKLAEVKRSSAKEVREEWAALSEADRKEETERARERAPDPRTFAADVERSGILTLYPDSATLRLETPDGDVLAMAFVSLEEGKWKVTGGPMTFEPTPAETAAPIEGAAILDHEIGKLAIEYAKRLEAGRIDAAIELLSGPARAKRAAEPAAERQESDAYRRRTTPPAAAFAEQIRGGGSLRFFGDEAALNVVTNESTKNPDGSMTFTSSTTALPFELEDGKWRVAD